jgi:hypothetical protein
MTKKNLLFKPVILIEFTYNYKYDTTTTNNTKFNTSFQVHIIHQQEPW